MSTKEPGQHCFTNPVFYVGKENYPINCLTMRKIKTLDVRASNPDCKNIDCYLLLTTRGRGPHPWAGLGIRGSYLSFSISRNMPSNQPPLNCLLNQGRMTFFLERVSLLGFRRGCTKMHFLAYCKNCKKRSRRFHFNGFCLSFCFVELLSAASLVAIFSIYKTIREMLTSAAKLKHKHSWHMSLFVWDWSPLTLHILRHVET